MKSVLDDIWVFAKTTLVGGFLLIVPFGILFVLFDKALNLFRTIVAPIAGLIPIEHIGGITLNRILAFFVLLFLCFIAGLLAKTRVAAEKREWLEQKLQSVIPGYSLIKGMTETIAGLESNNMNDVVMVDIEEVWQIGFLMGKIDDDLSTVFLPGAPSPLSGDVVFVKNERIRKLNISEVNAISIHKKLGQGAEKYLKGKVHAGMFDKKEK
ncbi:DUF502 domain-containing protein [Reichenbachiella carrageenanivorans]|uniref:DUF502 domain-containing protein n=1 Tax=Reichenbachiella carrageenanivorans TaxID=2979869 RepID=A0ABY6CYZ2_9BACT|nr:DUF502 domain-containing protein [Reichenbachiella carrageenanivorans]UXX79135.1 DUF502 domain-containing protein [Reichenbachiella carrageenanivorans]